MKRLNVKAVPLAVAFALIGVTGLTACNTVRGAGQDIQGAGEAVQEGATDVQRDLNDGNPTTP